MKSDLTRKFKSTITRCDYEVCVWEGQTVLSLRKILLDIPATAEIVEMREEEDDTILVFREEENNDQTP